ncbi:MAG: DUF5054 domain-containing protein [Pseudomonadota bacterium]
MTRPKIHLVFKTHLDIGFSGLAKDVRRQYHSHFIPQALETAEHFWQEAPGTPKFIWTTGAWLIADYLDGAGADEVARMEQAIQRGLIRWHAMPFTTHSELMSAAVFRAGLSYSQQLDQRFGRVTTAAKMTDVPGHTRGIVPLLAEAGVRFLHLGVNEASPMPEVPAVFRWQADGAEIVVMYQDSYGATQVPPGMTQGLSFAHTNDNVGPQSVSQTIDAYRHLQAAHPDAEIAASSLDDFGDLLWERRAELAVVDQEMGDSWIYGVGSDPDKVSQFLALQRVYDQWQADPLTPCRLAFGRGLAMVAEHTWGVDIKTFLRDETAWDRPDFETARKSDPRFAFAERSWAEQRDYLDQAIAQLGPEDRRFAEAQSAIVLPPPQQTSAAPQYHEIAGWTVWLDLETGDITSLILPDGQVLAGVGALLGYRYESYDATDIGTHLDSYLTRRPDWAILDHAKPGLATARTVKSARWAPQLQGITRQDDALWVSALMPAEAHQSLGAPASIDLVLRPESASTVSLTLILRNKPANRMPEASFLTIAPGDAQHLKFRKLGLWHPASRVVRQGGGQLQAIEAAQAQVYGRMLHLAVLDTPLVGPADTDFMRYDPEPPDFAPGLRFCLHTNKWGTNFPMWWQGDLMARFRLSLPGAGLVISRV